MAAFWSVVVALCVAWLTLSLERSHRVGPRLSAMLLTLAGLALITFATINLLLVEEPVHVLPGTAGTAFIALGAWRMRSARRRLLRHPEERAATPVRSGRPEVGGRARFR